MKILNLQSDPARLVFLNMRTGYPPTDYSSQIRNIRWVSHFAIAVMAWRAVWG
jgi:hypothetical protein